MNKPNTSNLESATVVGGSRVNIPPSHDRRKSNEKPLEVVPVKEPEEMALQSSPLSKPMLIPPEMSKIEKEKEVVHMHQKPQPKHNEPHIKQPIQINQPK